MSKIFLLCFAHHLPSKPVVFTDDYWSWLPGSQACSTEDLLLHVPWSQHLSALPPRTIRATGDNFVQLVHEISEVLQLGFNGVEPSKSFFVAQLGVCVWLILRSKLVLQHGEAKESGIACVRSDHVAWINCHRPRFTRKLFADTRSMSQI